MSVRSYVCSVVQLIYEDIGVHLMVHMSVQTLCCASNGPRVSSNVVVCIQWSTCQLICRQCDLMVHVPLHAYTEGHTSWSTCSMHNGIALIPDALPARDLLFILCPL